MTKIINFGNQISKPWLTFRGASGIYLSASPRVCGEPGRTQHFGRDRFEFFVGRRMGYLTLGRRRFTLTWNWDWPRSPEEDMPTQDEIFEKVQTTLVDALGVDEEDVTRDATLFSDLGAESIDLLDIVFRLERNFGIKIPRGEIGRAHV